MVYDLVKAFFNAFSSDYAEILSFGIRDDVQSKSPTHDQSLTELEWNTQNHA